MAVVVMVGSSGHIGYSSGPSIPGGGGGGGVVMGKIRHGKFWHNETKPNFAMVFKRCACTEFCCSLEENSAPHVVEHHIVFKL